MGLGMGCDPRLPDKAGDEFCRACHVGEGHLTIGPVPDRVAGVCTDLIYPRGLPGPLGVSRNAYYLLQVFHFSFFVLWV